MYSSVNSTAQHSTAQHSTGKGLLCGPCAALLLLLSASACSTDSANWSRAGIGLTRMD